MSRSKWKGPYIEEDLLKKVFNKRLKNSVITKSRSSVIVPSFVGINFKVYNGKVFYPLKVTEKMIGYKFCEFSPTRKQFSFKKKRNKNKWDKKLILFFLEYV